MLHPQAQAFIDLLIERKVPPTHTLTPADARKFYRERRAVTQPEPGEVAEVRELTAPGPHGAIPLRYYRPLGSANDAVLPVLVYYHGGGWTIGDLDTHDTLCRELCNLSGCALVAVDYRMGPEHRFPAAVDDALVATYWVREHADSLGVDAARLAIGGDSAGGNLAAVVAIAARDAGNLPLAFQLLIYPATDMRRGHPSHTTNGQGYVLTSDSIRYFHDHYIADPQHDLDWRASPLLHPDLSRLPPALVLTAGYDPLRDEGLDYARALTAVGNRAVYVCFERQIHGFITMGRLIDEANAAVSMCAAELRRALVGMRPAFGPSSR
ncbi:acetyl hydrolase [Variovorax sp. WS11]|uniref:alpha/beta hydrolase n=1 Tax=Variovorax sp. WS11 TaxID=1105204 RepID=UPI000D0CCBBA|nr:alpha/beta hydrolase [Variovorax sp. WS11]NDZ14432.1 alpha/beta hydrolase [Variovorax sp. WS11]PSL81525.1 acetyl hydrolase [Variovorax sp. WS11]